jgi:adenosine kinase
MSNAGIILGIGNPLLDISANVPEEFLVKYGLKHADAILADDRHCGLYSDLVENFPVEYIAGGATQNSIRAAQWMLSTVPGFVGSTAYIGCVGSDAYSETLEKAARADGVDVHYMKKEGVPTGTCAVLVVRKDRSMVANLAAANCYEETHVVQNWHLVERARIVYSAGFFLTVSPETALRVARHCADAGKIYSLNLSAPFIVQFFWAGKMDAVMPYVDIVFGNDDEARALGTAREWGTDVVEVAKKLQALPSSKAKPRMVVITCGKDPVVVVTSEGVLRFDVPLVPSEEIVDTNGAGDCFVAGFLAGLALGKGIEECVRAGNYCAAVIIRTSGIKFSGSPSFF